MDQKEINNDLQFQTLSWLLKTKEQLQNIVAAQGDADLPSQETLDLLQVSECCEWLVNARLVKTKHKKIKKIADRRYYLNRTLKALNVEVNTTTRTLKLPYKTFQEIPEGIRYYVSQCINNSYNVQYELF